MDKRGQDFQWIQLIYIVIPFVIGAVLIGLVRSGGVQEAVKLKAYSREAGALINDILNLPEEYQEVGVLYPLPDGYHLFYRDGRLIVEHGGVSKNFPVNLRKGFAIMVKEEHGAYLIERRIEEHGEN